MHCNRQFKPRRVLFHWKHVHLWQYVFEFRQCCIVAIWVPCRVCRGVDGNHYGWDTVVLVRNLCCWHLLGHIRFCELYKLPCRNLLVSPWGINFGVFRLCCKDLLRRYGPFCCLLGDLRRGEVLGGRFQFVRKLPRRDICERHGNSNSVS